MRSVIIVSLAAGVLSGCCGGHPSSASVQGKARVARASSGHRLTCRESGLVRVPDQTHVYKVGRLADGDSMREGGNYYHIEQSAKPAPKARLNVDSNGVILKGYDPVAYFTRHQAVKGNPAIQTRFGGATYYFVSVADKVAFSKNPSKYVPQYGGFCAYHLSKDELRDSDPTAFLIYKGKLYLFRRRWRQRISQ